MKLLNVFPLLLLFTAAATLISCNGIETSDQSQPAESMLPENGIAIEEARARPGRENGVSAIYLHIANGSAETDSLIRISSPVADVVELHESFEQENGMVGMREAEFPAIPGRSIISLRPGGLHIMLMQLNRPLNEGDEFELTLEFALDGEKIISIPVQGTE